jgi:hypothetical protein
MASQAQNPTPIVDSRLLEDHAKESFQQSGLTGATLASRPPFLDPLHAGMRSGECCLDRDNSLDCALFSGPLHHF